MVDKARLCRYNDVINRGKGGLFMRKAYLDNVRWGVQIFVVLYHVFYMYNGVGVLGGLGRITSYEPQWWDLFLYAVYPWLMPVLFLVSGISAKYDLERHTDGEFARRRTVRLLVPSTVGLFVFQFLQGAVSMGLSGAFDTMEGIPGVVRYLVMALSGIGVLWYLQVLWVLSMLLLLIRKIVRGRVPEIRLKKGYALLCTALVVPVWAAGLILNTPVIAVYRFGLYGAVFFLGYAVLSRDDALGALKKWFPLFLAAALALGAAFCFLYFGENYADAPVNRSPLFAGYGWFASLAILGGAARYADRETAFTRRMARSSFGLYLFHYLGISAVALFLVKPGLVSPAAAYALSTLAGFGAGWLLGALIPRIPVLRWCVMGIEKRRSGEGKEEAHVRG